MKRSNLLMAVGTLGAIGAITLAGSSAVLADDNIANDSLAQKIAQKFNLNQTDVQAVINENRQSRHQDRLDNLVTDGKITEAQKDLILNKMQEWHDNKPDFANMDRTERQDAIQKHRDEMQTWAKDNGIDPSIFENSMGKHGNREQGNRHGQMNQ
jgi:hypothetical protein